ncbi:MAG: phosphoenolpyruvate--protein phosphotransferase, partial [Negativicutes bacterium]|nr:phosphoenolpyruvate--protein phosphotransferase [Negativicutes bacterium]
MEKQVNTSEFQGKAVVKGVAVARLKVLSTDLTEPLKRYQAGDPETEKHRLHAAIAKCQDELSAIIEKAREAKEEEKANIMEAHFLMLSDPTLTAAAEEKIVAGKSSPAAILEASEETAQMFAAIDDPYLRERAADVRDVGRRVARMILGIRLEFGEDPIIICAMDIEPST